MTSSYANQGDIIKLKFMVVHLQDKSKLTIQNIECTINGRTFYFNDIEVNNVSIGYEKIEFQ